MNWIKIGLLFILIVIGYLAYSQYHLAEKVKEQNEEIATLKEELKIANVELRALKKITTMSLETLTLKGDVVGELTNNTIATGAVDSAKIADGSIGKEDVNAEEIQLRISESCPPGSFIVSVEENGSVVCRAPNTTNTENVENSRNFTTISTRELCLSGECRESWPTPSLNLTTKYYYWMGDRAKLGFWDVCSIIGVTLSNETADQFSYGCSLGIERRFGWVLRVEEPFLSCDVVCFNISVSGE